MRGVAFGVVAFTAACSHHGGPAGDGVPDAAGDDVIDAAPGTGIDAGAGAALPAFCASYPPPDLATAKQSKYVHYDAGGHLQYTPDADGDRIPDFSYAGYHHGERALPVVAEAMRVGPTAGGGDDTARLQAALDQVAALPLDGDGHRGALVLDPGTYEIDGTLHVRASGVVLRGAGAGDDPATSTILRAPGDSPHQRSVVTVGGHGLDWRKAKSGTQVTITTPKVIVGDRSFEVDAPDRLAVGDRVVVRHPSTAAWIAALGGGGAQVAWTPGDLDIPYLRRVVGKDGARITLDIPVYNHLDHSLATSVVYAVDDTAVVREVGVEHLRVDVVSAGGTDENHAWNAIDVGGAEDAWVDDVTALHFGYAGVRVHDADAVTVTGSHAWDAVAIVTGGRMYNFAADDFAQEILFVGCEARLARHSYVSNGTSSVSDVVFLHSRVVQSQNSSEGHRRWSQGLLYDNITESMPKVGNVVGLYNRGDWGTQHGWAAAHSVLWRYDTAGKTATLQRPPTAQNWAIGTVGTVTSNGPFAGGPGIAEPIAGTLAPASLYEAQLCDRLRAATGP
jgi:hypothetical protein